jgi:hypothetical protein
MKEGYYVAIIAGGGGGTVLYCDGKELFAHGTDKPLNTGFIEFISTAPIDPMDIPGVAFTPPRTHMSQVTTPWRS